MTDRPPVTRVSPKEAEDEAAHFLAVRLAPRIDALNERVDRPEAATVPAGSPLAGDDRASHPFQMSHAAWYGITHAIDNLYALRLLTVSGEDTHFDVRTHPFAAFPTLRAALENASIAVWLLAPDSRDTRLVRRFRLALQDAKNGDEVAQLIGHEPTTREKHRSRVAAILTDRPSVALDACERPAGFRLIVREAAEGYGTDPATAVVIWRLLSGLTHGDTWAGLSFTDREEVAVSADGTVTLRTTSSLANVANTTRYVVALTETALALYDRRRTPAF